MLMRSGQTPDRGLPADSLLLEKESQGLGCWIWSFWGKKCGANQVLASEPVILGNSSLYSNFQGLFLQTAGATGWGCLEAHFVTDLGLSLVGMCAVAFLPNDGG